MPDVNDLAQTPEGVGDEASPVVEDAASQVLSGEAPVEPTVSAAGSAEVEVEPAVAPVEPSVSAAGSAETSVEPSTRASRRARRAERDAPSPTPVLATVPRRVPVLASFVMAAFLILAARTDHVVLAAALAWVGLVVAWGWPTLLGSLSRVGSSVAIGIAAILAPVSAALLPNRPHLGLVPVALAIALVAMFLHQLVRRDGRARLVESLATTAGGLAVITTGVTYAPLGRTEGGVEIACAAFVAIAAGAIAELFVDREKLRPWLLPASAAVGGVVAAGVAIGFGGPSVIAALVLGALCAAVGFGVRRVLAALPAIQGPRGQLASAAAGMLYPGVIAYAAALAIVG